MRTFPRLSKEPNEHGFYEIKWSELRNGEWRSRRRSSRAKNRGDAEKALAEFLTLRAVDIDRDQRSFADVVEIYIRQHSRPRGNEITDRRVLRAPVGAFGEAPAASISDADVQSYSRARSRGQYGPKKVKPSTIRREIVALQAVLNWALRKDLIRANRPFRFEKPSDDAVRDLWLTAEQEREVLDALHDAPVSVRIFTRLALTYGVRRGAIMDLRYDGAMVNFVTNTINFNVPGKPTNRKRRPVVPMTRTIRDDLSAAFQGGGWVCERNTPKVFKAFMRSIGYEWVTPHVLKHTAITSMLRQGVPPGDVSKLTATDLRTIYRVYRHHTADELLGIAEARGI